MVNEAEEHLTESGASVPVNISSEVEKAGVITHHEDEEHRVINAGLEGTGASVSSAAAPIVTQDSGMVKLPEVSEPDKSLPTNDTSRYRRFVDFIGSVRAKRGGLKNAA